MSGRFRPPIACCCITCVCDSEFNGRCCFCQGACRLPEDCTYAGSGVENHQRQHESNAGYTNLLSTLHSSCLNLCAACLLHEWQAIALSVPEREVTFLLDPVTHSGLVNRLCCAVTRQ